MQKDAADCANPERTFAKQREKKNKMPRVRLEAAIGYFRFAVLRELRRPLSCGRGNPRMRNAGEMKSNAIGDYARAISLCGRQTT
jgi:hypothetical protein